MTPRRVIRPRRFAPVVLAGVLALALVACGDDDGDLSASDVESTVRAAIGSGGFERDQITEVSCPSGQPREDGHSFDCTATVAGEDVTVTIDQRDGVEVATAVYETGSVEEEVEGDFFENTATAVSASCSEDAAIVVAIGSTFDCTVEDRDARTQELTVTAQTSGAYVFETPAFPGS